MLSIVIPCLNEEKFLPQLLQSIKDSDFKDYEIIVSDANSSDRTIEEAKKFTNKIVKDKKGSPARQRNLGANLAKGSVILFLDADTSLAKGFLEKIYQEFLKRNLGVAGFYLKFKSNKFFHKIIEVILNKVFFLGQFTVPATVGSGIIIKRDIHKKIQGFDESVFIGEDHDYIKRAKKYGKYRVIKSRRLLYSVRRLEKEGGLRVLWKWIRGTIYFLFKGPIRKKIVPYDFGEY